MTLKKWAEENNMMELYNQYIAECEQIADECEEEGYPRNGSNYDLRIERLKESYPEFFVEE